MPSTRTQPSDGRSKPTQALSRVDLPDPFGPTSAVILPSGTPMVTVTQCPAPPNVALAADVAGLEEWARAPPAVPLGDGAFAPIVDAWSWVG